MVNARNCSSCNGLVEGHKNVKQDRNHHSSCNKCDDGLVGGEVRGSIQMSSLSQNKSCVIGSSSSTKIYNHDFLVLE